MGLKMRHPFSALSAVAWPGMAPVTSTGRAKGAGAVLAGKRRPRRSPVSQGLMPKSASLCILLGYLNGMQSRSETQIGTVEMARPRWILFRIAATFFAVVRNNCFPTIVVNGKTRRAEVRVGGQEKQKHEAKHAAAKPHERHGIRLANAGRAAALAVLAALGGAPRQNGPEQEPARRGRRCSQGRAGTGSTVRSVRPAMSMSSLRFLASPIIRPEVPRPGGTSAKW